MPDDPTDQRLRQHMKPPPREPDLSLGFLRDKFKREVQRPMKQIGELAVLWDQLVPGDIASHTRLESLSRGVLRVAVDSSARLYQLDRLLRGGLRKQLISQHKGPAVRRIQLRVNADWT